MVLHASILAATLAAWAVPPPPAAVLRVADPIHGVDAMGDKGQSGPDGWVNAPITRNQAPGGQSAGQNEAQAHSSPNALPNPGANKPMPRGQDPFTPEAPASAGPGTLSTPAGAR